MGDYLYCWTFYQEMSNLNSVDETQGESDYTSMSPTTREFGLNSNSG